MKRDRFLDDAERIIGRLRRPELVKHVARMQRALDNARVDRERLLRRLGLTDREWAMQGGASYTDVEP